MTEAAVENLPAVASGKRPLFGFRFSPQGVSPLDALPDPDRFPRRDGEEGFLWCHLDLLDDASVTWLLSLPAPEDVGRAVAYPAPRGRLFAVGHLIYGQLRDLLAPPAAAPDGLEAGALSVLILRGLVVTGWAEPLKAVECLRGRIAGGAVEIDSPIELLTAFFVCLNELSDELLDRATDSVVAMEARILKSHDFSERDDLVRIRREAVRLMRDMSYKRTSLAEFLREAPEVGDPGHYRALQHEIERYQALIDDFREFTEHCQYLLDEQRAQVDEAANRHLYILTTFSAIFMPATLIAGMWGMNVAWLPFGTGADGFWALSLLIGASVGAVLIWLRWMRLF